MEIIVKMEFFIDILFTFSTIVESDPSFFYDPQ
jgi:hypothetical protein